MTQPVYIGAGVPKVSAWFPNFKPNPRAGLRLFCLPYSGAGASIYNKWLTAFPTTIEVCPIQLPGREARLSEHGFTRIQPLVAALAQALLPSLDKPFVFFGHSMGALVSFEVARYLRRHYDVSPLHLFVSGHGAPHLPDDDPPIHALPEPEFAQKLRDLNGTPEEVLQHAELRQLLLPILRADFAACETYTYEPDAPLDCSISALGGLHDTYAGRDRLAAWKQETRASFSVRMFPGNHFFINTARQLVVQTVARELNQILRTSVTGKAHDTTVAASTAHSPTGS
jgi:medium-chain acyl-[acyl-carrier-protein] hydrolase